MTSVRSGLAARLFPAGLVVVIVGFGLYFDHAASSSPVDSFGDVAASPQVRQVAQWAVSTQDHGGLPFVVVDNAQSRIYAFDPQGHLRGDAPVHLDADGAQGRLVADPAASIATGAVVWVNARAQLAVDARGVEEEFWQTCLAALRTQPSVAYVLPAAGVTVETDMRTATAARRPS